MMSVASGAASASSRLVVIVTYLVLISHIVIQLSFSASLNLSEFSVDKKDPNYWQKRRDWFYKQTRFDLSDDNHRLLGTKRLLYENKSAEPVGHLPFWFDYELFKEVFKKSSADNKEEELARHNAYINTCLRVLKARVLYRMLAGTSDTFITSDANKFHWEKFGQVQENPQEGNDNNEISFSVGSRIVATPSEQEEAPLDRAIRLVKQEMDIVESRNQVVTNLKAFKELDGSAIKAKLPYLL